MPFANNITSYPDCHALYEKALASDKGVQVTFDTKNEAIFQAGRINAYRVRLRRNNSKVYPADHPMHGASEFDGIMVRQKENVVELHKLTIAQLKIEEL